MVNRFHIKNNSVLLTMATSIRSSNWVQLAELLLVAKANQWFILTYKVRRYVVIRDPSILSSSAILISWSQMVAEILAILSLSQEGREAVGWSRGQEQKEYPISQKLHP